MMHNALSVNDIKEPMDYVFKKMNKDGNLKAYALGCSMGANILSNYLGIDQENSILSGAVCVQAAIKKWEVLKYFMNSLNGTYDKALGKY
jgi:predicted alpha/beta-fold hydrolase